MHLYLKIKKLSFNNVKLILAQTADNATLPKVFFQHFKKAFNILLLRQNTYEAE